MKSDILRSICALVLSFTICAFCGAGASPAAGDALTAPQPENPVVLLNGYEDQGDLSTLMLYENLGKVELNSDKVFVKSGEKSGKVSVLQDLYNGRNKTIKPYLFQSSRNVSKGTIENDFKKTVGLGFSIYNANEEEKTIGVRLVYYRDYHMGAKTEATQEFTLAPKAWTEVYLSVVREKISLNTPRYGDNREIKLAVGYDIIFSAPDKGTKDDIFYLDDARLYKTTDEVASDAEVPVKTHEICSFDSEWQVNSLGYSNHTSYFTGVEWSKAFTTDGGASLKILTGGGTTTTYMQISKGTYFPHIELADYTDDDSLKMEFYSPADNGYSGSVTIWLINSANAIFCVKSYIISPGSVTFVDMPVGEINSDTRADIGSGKCFEYLNKIQISVSGTPSANILYLDNVRMEKTVGV